MLTSPTAAGKAGMNGPANTLFAFKLFGKLSHPLERLELRHRNLESLDLFFCHVTPP
jgi:hypothetical protein